MKAILTFEEVPLVYHGNGSLFSLNEDYFLSLMNGESPLDWKETTKSWRSRFQSLEEVAEQHNNLVVAIWDDNQIIQRSLSLWMAVVAFGFNADWKEELINHLLQTISVDEYQTLNKEINNLDISEEEFSYLRSVIVWRSVNGFFSLNNKLQELLYVALTKNKLNPPKER